MADLLDVTEDDRDVLAEEGLKKMKFKRLVKAVNAAKAVKAGGANEGANMGREEAVEGGGVDDVDEAQCFTEAHGDGGGSGGGGGGESKDDSNGAAGSMGDEAGECVVCMDGENTHLIFPCGHKCVCKGCAALIMRTTAECPTCRGEAREVVRVFS